MYTIQALTQENAVQIAYEWHYETPYDFYDLANDPEDLAELIDPLARGNAYFEVLEGDQLLAYFCVDVRDSANVDFGIGLRPDLTGHGQGEHYLTSILAYIDTTFHPRTIHLAVATFNDRAIHLYQKLNFVPLDVYQQATNGGHYPFLRMKRDFLNPSAPLC